MLLVDSHCHLNFPDFREDLDEVVARAKAAGVGVMQTICTEMEEFEEVAAIASRFEGVYCSVGVHPNDSGKTKLVELDALIAAASHPKVIGIGETGLDYYYENSDRATQQESFKRHIAAAQETGLPVIVHTRNAEDDTLEILSNSMKEKPFTGVIHCFTSSHAFAEGAMALGLYVSFSGIVTFKNARELHESAAKIPLYRLLIETDSPYLAPVPHRGKRNEPSFVRYVNKMLAELKGEAEETVAKATTDNFFRLFSKAKRP